MKMDDLKHQMKDHFIKYASYVILDRAIPNVVDGLKPVQRRILEILWRQNDDKLHKVANIVGQTMQLHPHGDAPIYEALVTLGQQGLCARQAGEFRQYLYWRSIGCRPLHRNAPFSSCPRDPFQSRYHRKNPLL